VLGGVPPTEDDRQAQIAYRRLLDEAFGPQGAGND
jgi:hypothetical protein